MQASRVLKKHFSRAGFLNSPTLIAKLPRSGTQHFTSKVLGIFIIRGLPRKVLAQAGLPAEACAFCACPEGPAKHARVAGQQTGILILVILQRATTGRPRVCRDTF